MKLFLFLLSIFIVFSASATHVAGGVISYIPAGNTNEYEYTFTVYRDCDAVANLGTTVDLNLTNTCGIAVTSQIILTKISVEEISQVCVSELPNTSCNGTGFIEGMEKQVFKGIYVLPGVCDNWLISFKTCNRNSII